MNTFKTHTGDIVTDERLKVALDAVADDLVRQAHDIRKEDSYASHVPEATKDAKLSDDLHLAEDVRNGSVKSLTIWQRVNEKLTGECVAILP